MTLRSGQGRGGDDYNQFPCFHSSPPSTPVLPPLYSPKSRQTDLLNMSSDLGNALLKAFQWPPNSVSSRMLYRIWPLSPLALLWLGLLAVP